MPTGACNLGREAETHQLAGCTAAADVAIIALLLLQLFCWSDYQTISSMHY
jgi:hypothetical protein